MSSDVIRTQWDLEDVGGATEKAPSKIDADFLAAAMGGRDNRAALVLMTLITGKLMAGEDVHTSPEVRLEGKGGVEHVVSAALMGGEAVCTPRVHTGLCVTRRHEWGPVRGVGVRNAVEVKLGVGGAKHAHGAIQSRGVQLCWRRVEEEENGPRRKTLRQWCQEGATVHGSAAPIRDVIFLGYLRAQAVMGMPTGSGGPNDLQTWGTTPNQKRCRCSIKVTS